MIFEGLEELKAELRVLPETLVGEGTHIVTRAADEASGEMIRAYEGHHYSGNLAAHVSVSQQETGRGGILAIVKNTAAHAWIFENGTQARHTSLGAFRGVMPAGHVFVPIAIRNRRAMYDALKAMIARQGLEVSGDV